MLQIGTTNLAATSTQAVTLSGAITLKLYSNSEDLGFETAYHGIFNMGDKLQLFTVEEGTDLAAALSGAQFTLNETFTNALNGGVWDMRELASTGYITVVPEPASASLSLLALAALCARRRRRK